MIDREARNRLLQGIEDYMDEKISPVEFYDLLHVKIAPKTKDKLIDKISLYLIGVDDDIGTNRLQSVCSYWKFFNRCRLLLASDAYYQAITSPRRINFTWWYGGLSFLTIATLGLLAFWGEPMTIFLICMHLWWLCGVVAFVFFFDRFTKAEHDVLFAEYPFESFADLLAVRRSVPDFLSKRFPNKPPIPTPSQNRVVRFLWDTKCPVWVDYILSFPLYFVLCFLLVPFLVVVIPFVSLLSCLVGSSTQTRLVLPGYSTTDSL